MAGAGEAVRSQVAEAAGRTGPEAVQEHHRGLRRVVGRARRKAAEVVADRNRPGAAGVGCRGTGLAEARHRAAGEEREIRRRQGGLAEGMGQAAGNIPLAEAVLASVSGPVSRFPRSEFHSRPYGG